MSQLDTMQAQIRAKAKELLESGEVASFVGWESGRFPNQTTPFVCYKPADADRLVFNEYCVVNLAKYALTLKQRGRVGLCVRGCDTRAINRMVQDNQLTREDVFLVGLPCPQMKNRETDEVLPKCTMCSHRNPVLYDVLVGEPVAETPPADRFAGVADIEAMSVEERQAFFNEAYSKCIRCRACQKACPCCTCRICFVDQRKVGWQGKQSNLSENRFYGAIRSFHVSDRCIECGECERVCPMGLPLMTLMRKMTKDMNELFGEYESGMTDQNPDVLVRYRTEDVEEFM